MVRLFRARYAAAVFWQLSVLIFCLPSAALHGQIEAGWFAFNPRPDPFMAENAFDLLELNERFAGEGGFIAIRDGQFVHSQTGKPVRFWAVNISPGNVKPEALKLTARTIAKHGVNLVRIHGGYFKKADGSIDEDRIQEAIQIVEAMKAQGIYSHFSTYFPLWFEPKPGLPWLPGYDGKAHPFAALYFNPAFQQKYRSWWEALLTTPSRTTGKKLIDDPAVFGAEIINEDSYFFWTFNPSAIPDAELQIVEAQFGSWVAKRYGRIDAALSKWHDRLPRDNPAAGRVAFRPLWNMANQRTPRDKDTAAFLTQSQRQFYENTYQFLRSLGFKGLITASNWATASPEYLGPLEKYTYTACDFIDRHGYVSCNDNGPNSWAIMKDQTYSDRSGLRFEPEKRGPKKEFANPVMDIHYDGKPSMISETTFNRPNRYRSEAPLYYACYGALQDSNCIVHFSLDGSAWTVKPQYFMQPWSLMTPAMMGQFPAAALIYRQGLVSVGDELVKLNLKISDIEDLQGTPLPQDASFDELRARDIPPGAAIRPGDVIDPLVHYAGRTSVLFTQQGGPAKLTDLKPLIDRRGQTVVSSTHQLRLDYGKGILTIDAPMAQGISGDLHAAGTTELKDMIITSDMPLGHIIAVSLDGKPLATSGRILLQVMSEEQNSGWQTQPVDATTKKITDAGRDPWLVKRISGTVQLKRPDAAKLHLQPLTFNAYPRDPVTSAATIHLMPDVIYYLIKP
jgi:hypothetical protein